MYKKIIIQFKKILLLNNKIIQQNYHNKNN